MKRYDRAYFERWYRDPRSRVKTPADVARKVRMVVGVAEYVLGRPVRSVLDVGCGEGSWRSILRRLRPRASYVGVDPSEYVVRRFGRSRNIRHGGLADLDRHGWSEPFDLIVCCDVLNYLPTRDVTRGLGHVRDLLGGIAYLEIFTAADGVSGDTRGWHRRPGSFYRRLFDRLELTACGLHCYAAAAAAEHVTQLERPTPRRVARRHPRLARTA